MLCAQVALDMRTHAPDWVSWGCTRIAADLDGDGDEELLALDRGRVDIYDDDLRRYVSPVGWAVSDAFCAEMDEEPGPEVVLVVWKRGSFGRELPFWHDRNDNDVSQHIFIFKYRDGGLQPLWMSSALEGGARSVALDEACRMHLVDALGQETVWEWEYFGLKLVEDEPEAQESEAQEPAEGGSAGEARADAASADADADAVEDETVTFVAVGDNLIHDSLYAQMHTTDASHFDFSPVYAQVADAIGAADLAAVVQETALVEDPADFAGYPSFGTPTAVGDALADAGFDIVCAATNHAFDRGADGVGETVAFWSAVHPEITLLGLYASGQDAEGFEIREAEGVRLALLDSTYGLNEGGSAEESAHLVDQIGDGSALVQRVARAEQQADLTICFLHIGEEYAAEPTAEQRDLACRLADAGADVVICSHPHVVQPVERIETAQGAHAVVYWSLGNFASHQTEPRTLLGGMAQLAICRDAATGEAFVADAQLIPLVCHYTPRTTAVYFLEDYTDALAAEHYLTTQGADMSPEALRSLWNVSVGTGPTDTL